MKNDDFILILKNTRPPGPDYQSCMDITYENNTNEKFSPTLKSTQPLGPGYKI